MKPVRLTLLAALAASLLLSACITDGKEGAVGGPDIRVRIVDTAGAAISADTVYWSYKADGVAMHKADVAAHGTDTTTKAAARLNAAGTEWGFSHEGLHGAVYIRAAYHKNVNAFCEDDGYKQLAITADSLPKEVTLILEVTRYCE